MENFAGLRTPDVPSDGGKMDKKAVEDTIQTLEDIKGSVEFYERDKPEFVEVLQRAIEAIEKVAKLQKELKELEKKNAKQYEALQDLADTLAEFQKENEDLKKEIKEREATPYNCELKARITELEKRASKVTS